MAKKTLAQQLQEVQASNEYNRGKAEARADEISGLKQRADRAETEIRGSLNAHAELSRKLMEIVRWMVNKDTAQYPFQAEKGQRTNEQYRQEY